MIIGTFTQQPSDILDYDVDCSGLLGGADSIQSASVSVSPSGLTVSSMVVGGTNVKLWVSGGSSGITYKAEITVTTVNGRRKQDELKFKIKEV